MIWPVIYYLSSGSALFTSTLLLQANPVSFLTFSDINSPAHNVIYLAARLAASFKVLDYHVTRKVFAYVFVITTLLFLVLCKLTLPDYTKDAKSLIYYSRVEPSDAIATASSGGKTGAQVPNTQSTLAAPLPHMYYSKLAQSTSVAASYPQGLSTAMAQLTQEMMDLSHTPQNQLPDWLKDPSKDPSGAADFFNSLGDDIGSVGNESNYQMGSSGVKEFLHNLKMMAESIAPHKGDYKEVQTNLVKSMVSQANGASLKKGYDQYNQFMKPYTANNPPNPGPMYPYIQHLAQDVYNVTYNLTHAFGAQSGSVQEKVASYISEAKYWYSKMITDYNKFVNAYHKAKGNSMPYSKYKNLLFSPTDQATLMSDKFWNKLKQEALQSAYNLKDTEEFQQRVHDLKPDNLNQLENHLPANMYVPLKGYASAEKAYVKKLYESGVPSQLETYVKNYSPGQNLVPNQYGLSPDLAYLVIKGYDPSVDLNQVNIGFINGKMIFYPIVNVGFYPTYFFSNIGVLCKFLWQRMTEGDVFLALWKFFIAILIMMVVIRVSDRISKRGDLSVSKMEDLKTLSYKPYYARLKYSPKHITALAAFFMVNPYNMFDLNVFKKIILSVWAFKFNPFDSSLIVNLFFTCMYKPIIALACVVYPLILGPYLIFSFLARPTYAATWVEPFLNHNHQGPQVQDSKYNLLLSNQVGYANIVGLYNALANMDNSYFTSLAKHHLLQKLGYAGTYAKDFDTKFYANVFSPGPTREFWPVFWKFSIFTLIEIVFLYFYSRSVPQSSFKNFTGLDALTKFQKVNMGRWNLHRVGYDTANALYIIVSKSLEFNLFYKNFLKA